MPGREAGDLADTNMRQPHQRIHAHDGLSSSKEGSNGASGESLNSGAGPSRSGASHATSASMEDSSEVHRKWAAADDRVQELAPFVLDQPAKHTSDAEAKLRERDEEIRQMRAALLQGSVELQEARDELAALRALHGQKMLFWEHGARHLLGMVEHFLGSQAGPRQRDRQELESGRFGSEAMKLSLTLPTQAEGGDISSFRRLLKDVLKSNDGKQRRARKPPQKARGEEAGAKADQPGSSGDSSEQQQGTDVAGGGPTAEGADGLSRQRRPVAGGAVGGESSQSSRDPSPLRGGASVRFVGRNAALATQLPPAAKVANVQAAPFLTQLAQSFRQLLAMSQQKMPGVFGPEVATVPSPDFSQRSADRSPAVSATLGTVGQAERQRLKQCTDSIPPIKQGIAHTMRAVEQMLRGLDGDLRRNCEELFGLAELPEGGGDGSAQLGNPRDDIGSRGGPVETEAQRFVPIGEDLQMLVLVGLRTAQQRLTNALVEFLRLPQQLKTFFDVTRALSCEVNSFVPGSALQHAEAQAAAARIAEQQYLRRIEALQRRLQEVTTQHAAAAPGETALSKTDAEEGGNFHSQL